jgi:hypothetical protein
VGTLYSTILVPTSCGVLDFLIFGVKYSVPTTHTDVRKVVKSSATTKSRRSTKGQKKKSKEKKGEINLDKLRKDGKLNDMVKKQLAEYTKNSKIHKAST